MFSLYSLPYHLTNVFQGQEVDKYIGTEMLHLNIKEGISSPQEKVKEPGPD